MGGGGWPLRGRAPPARRRGTRSRRRRRRGWRAARRWPTRGGPAGDRGGAPACAYGAPRPPEDEAPEREGGERHDSDRQEPHGARLLVGQLHAAVLHGAWPERDEGVLLRDPVEAVEEEVAVARLVEKGVGDEVGAPDRHQARLLPVLRLARDGAGEHDWALAVRLGGHRQPAAVAVVGLGEALRAGLRERPGDGVAGVLIGKDGSRERKDGHQTEVASDRVLAVVVLDDGERRPRAVEAARAA